MLVSVSAITMLSVLSLQTRLIRNFTWFQKVFQEEMWPKKRKKVRKRIKRIIGFFFFFFSPEPIGFLHCKVLGKPAPQPEFSGKHQRNPRDPFRLQSRH